MSASFFTQLCRAIPADTDGMLEALLALDRMSDLSRGLTDFIADGVLLPVDKRDPNKKASVEFMGGDDRKMCIRVKGMEGETMMSLAGLMGFVGDLTLLKNKAYDIDFDRLQTVAIDTSAIAATGIVSEDDEKNTKEAAVYIALKTFARSVRDTISCMHACGIHTGDTKIIWNEKLRRITDSDLLGLCDEIDELLNEDYRKANDKVQKAKQIMSPINRLLEEALYAADTRAKLTWITKRVYDGKTEPTEAQEEAAQLILKTMTDPDAAKTLILDMSPGSGKTALELLPILLADAIPNKETYDISTDTTDPSTGGRKKANDKAVQHKRVLIATSLQMVSAKIAERAAALSAWPSVIPVKRVDGGVQSQKMTPFYSKRIFWEATVNKRTNRSIFTCTQGVLDNCPLTKKLQELAVDAPKLSNLKKRVTNSGALLSHRRWDWSDENNKHDAEVLVGTFEGVAKILEQIDIDEIGALVIDEWDELIIDPSDASRNVRAEAAVALQAWVLYLASMNIPVILGSGTASSLIKNALDETLERRLEDSNTVKITPQEYVAAHQTEFLRLLKNYGISKYSESYSGVKAMIRETDSLFNKESVQKCMAALAKAQFGVGFEPERDTYDTFLRAYFEEASQGSKISLRGFKAQSRVLLGVALLFRAGVEPPACTEPFFQFIYALHCQAAHREFLGDTIFTVFCQSKNDMQAWAFLLTAILAVIGAPPPPRSTTGKVLLSLARSGNNILIDDIYVNAARSSFSTPSHDLFIPACLLARHSSMMDVRMEIPPKTPPLIDIVKSSPTSSTITFKDPKTSKVSSSTFKESRPWAQIYQLLTACDKSLAEQLPRGVITINAELMTNTAIEDLIDQRPYFCVTTNKLGAGVDTPHIGVTAVVPIRRRPYVSNADQMQWLARGYRTKKCTMRFSMAPYINDDDDSLKIALNAADDDDMLSKDAATDLSTEVGIMAAKTKSSKYVQGAVRQSTRNALTDNIDSIFQRVNFADNVKTVSVVENVCCIPRPGSLSQFASQQMPRLDSRKRAKTGYTVLKDSACAPVETIRNKYNSLSGLLSSDTILSSLMVDACHRFASTRGDLTALPFIDSLETTPQATMKIDLALETPLSKGYISENQDEETTPLYASAIGECTTDYGTFRAKLAVTITTPDNKTVASMSAAQALIGAPSVLRRLAEHIAQQYRLYLFAKRQSAEMAEAMKKLFPHLFTRFTKHQSITYKYNPRDMSGSTIVLDGTLSKDLGLIFGSDIILGTLVATVASVLADPVTTVKVDAVWHKYSDIAQILQLADTVLGAGFLKNVLPCAKKVDTFAAPQTVYGDGQPYNAELASIIQDETASGPFCGLSGIARGIFNSESIKTKDMEKARAVRSAEPPLSDNPVAAVFTLCMRRLDVDHRSICAKLRAPADDNTTVDKPGISTRAFALMHDVIVDSFNSSKANREAWTNNPDISIDAPEESSIARNSRVAQFMEGYTNGLSSLQDFLKLDAGISPNAHHPYRHLMRKYVMTYALGLDYENECKEVDTNYTAPPPSEAEAERSAREHTHMRIELPYNDEQDAPII